MLTKAQPPSSGLMAGSGVGWGSGVASGSACGSEAGWEVPVEVPELSPPPSFRLYQVLVPKSMTAGPMSQPAAKSAARASTAPRMRRSCWPPL